MLIYQKINSTYADHVQIDVYTDFHFIPHLHRDLEFLLMLEGEMEVIVGGRTETAQAGDLALVLSNQIHAYHTQQHSKVLVCPFSGSYVREFVRLTEGFEGIKSVFPSDPALAGYLESCYLKKEYPDRLTLKATLYAICAKYLQCVQLKETKGANDLLLNKLLAYVEDHYRDNITIKSAARDIGYDENYLSRYFHATVGMNFRRYINQYRIEYACHFMSAGGRKIADIAMESGFQNIRSFNRAFLDSTGITPSEYIKR